MCGNHYTIFSILYFNMTSNSTKLLHPIESVRVSQYRYAILGICRDRDELISHLYWRNRVYMFWSTIAKNFIIFIIDNVSYNNKSLIIFVSMHSRNFLTANTEEFHRCKHPCVHFRWDLQHYYFFLLIKFEIACGGVDLFPSQYI